MIKENIFLALGITVLSLNLFACSSAGKSTGKEVDGPEANVAETGGREDKVPDPTTPKLAIISVYLPNEEKSGLYQEMDALETMDPQFLVDKLIEYSVLEDGTIVNVFKKEGTKGTLDLNKLDTSNKLMLTSLVNSFTENFELDTISISINGTSNAATSDLSFNKDYKELK